MVGLMYWAWRNRIETADSRKFIYVLCGFLIGTVLAFPLFIPFSQVLLILPALLVVRDWKTLPPVSRIIFAAAVSWPWIASVVLLLFPPGSDSQILQRLLFLVSFFPLFLLLVMLTGSKARSFRPAKTNLQV